jgi:hypothetical protein
MTYLGVLFRVGKGECQSAHRFGVDVDAGARITIIDAEAVKDGSTWKQSRLAQTVDGNTARRSAKFALLFLAGLLLVPMTAASAAEDMTAEWEWSSPLSAGTEPWRFSFIGYGWLPEAPATIKTDEGETVANMPEDFDSILDALEFAAMFEVEVHKGPFGVFVSPIYYDGDTSEGFTGALGERRSVKLEESVWVIDYGVSYDLGLFRLGESSDPPTVILQPYAGFRYLHDNIKLDLNPGLLDQGLRVRETLEFNTPIVGFDTEWDFTGGWGFRLGGDYGGFNVDDVNETYQIFGYLDYSFEMWDHTAKVIAGYRYLYVDYEKEVEIEVTIKGPLFGFGFEF